MTTQLTVLLLAAAAALPFNQVRAQELECAPKTVAIYSPGPNWPQLESRLDSHLHFVAELLKTKALETGGPFQGAHGEPTGGMMIYNSANRAEVEAEVQNDPLIQNQVATYELRAWLMCK
jgi:uncharacterized protein YciI